MLEGWRADKKPRNVISYHHQTTPDGPETHTPYMMLARDEIRHMLLFVVSRCFSSLFRLKASALVCWFYLQLEASHLADRYDVTQTPADH